MRLHWNKYSVYYLILIALLNVGIFLLVGRELSTLRPVTAQNPVILGKIVSGPVSGPLGTISPEKNLGAETISTLSPARIKQRQDQLAANSKEVLSFLQRKGLTANYAIAFTDLNAEEISFKHNENRNYAPASIYKLPLAMVILKQIDLEKVSLEQVLRYSGKTYTVAEALTLMITKSDNDAMTALERSLGGYNYLIKLIKTDLGVQIERRTMKATALEISKAFKILSATGINSYLSGANRLYLLGLLENVIPEHRDRIPAGMAAFVKARGLNPNDFRVFNKIGNLNGIYQDAALISSKDSNYVLIVLNNTRLTTDAAAEVKQITQLLFQGLE